METPLSRLQTLLEDSTVSDICINGAASTFFDRGRGLERAEEALFSSEDEYRQWIFQILEENRKTWDARFPFVDATLASGHRLHLTFPPASPRGPIVSLRRLGSARAHGGFWKDEPGFAFLRSLVLDGCSFLISGSTGSGKTTLLNELLEFVPKNQRIIALEDTAELAPRHPHFVSLSRPANADGAGELTLRDLLRQSLRMRPDRIVLGECRGTEVLELLQVLNTGHQGSVGTLHANSTRDAVRRLELLCLLAAPQNLSVTTLRELVATGVQFLVQVGRRKDRRQITEITRIAGREGDTLLFAPVPLESQSCM